MTGIVSSPPFPFSPFPLFPLSPAPFSPYTHTLSLLLTPSLSLLSTYSNLYNHPTKIEEPSSSASRHSLIPLSRKTGLPLGAIPGPLSKEKPGKQSQFMMTRH